MTRSDSETSAMRESPSPMNLFGVYKSLYSYDKTPLRADCRIRRGKRRLEMREDHVCRGLRQRARHGVSVPAQEVATPSSKQSCTFPGLAPSTFDPVQPFPKYGFIDFIIKSGRAVYVPCLQGNL